MPLYKKFISLSVLLAVFLFGNMAVCHAIAEENTQEGILHNLHSIHQVHSAITEDTDEPPHCIKSKVDILIGQQIRDNADGLGFIDKKVSLYNVSYSPSLKLLSPDTYFQYYPGSESHFFGHLLVGEKIILV